MKNEKKTKHINTTITILEFHRKGEFQPMTRQAVNGDNGLQRNTETQHPSVQVVYGSGVVQVSVTM